MQYHPARLIRTVDGDIAALALSDGRHIEGDLFIDCTGQRSLLIGEHFGTPLEPVDAMLFNNRALAVQVPYANAQAPIASTTRATAQQVGWIWDIGLQTRRGIGYVYSDQYQDLITVVEPKGIINSSR